MLFAGIDPGKTGALAVIDEHGEFVHGFDFESPQQVLEELKQLTIGSVTAAIEDVNSFGMGRQSAFSFGHNCGLWEGLLTALQIPCRHVRPQKWQKGVFRKADGKNASLETARRMFPTANLKLKKHHNRADALLIADWLRRELRQA